MADLLIDPDGIHVPSQKLKNLRIGNLLSFSLAYTAVAAALLVHPSITEIGDKHPTYFDSANHFVGILWVILFLLQFGFISYAQYNNLHMVQELVSRAINWHFIASNLFLIGFIWFWLQENFLIAESFLLLNTIVLAKIHKDIITYYPPNSIPAVHVKTITAFIHTPFSMYLVLNLSCLIDVGFVAFTNKDDVYVYVASVFTWFLFLIGLAWITKGMWSRGQRDGVFGTAVAWILLGIAVEQRDILPLSLQAIVLAIAQLIIIMIIGIRSGGNYSPRLDLHASEPLLRDEH